MTKTKKFVISTSLVLASVTVALLLCELAARLILHSADYFSVEMVEDKALGAVPSPSARSGFDAWGFRNRAVPESADIVAIGDSHTYGNTATMDESWPYVLGRLTGRRVYNMGMGGYGPNQYSYLLQNRALSLRPHVILCGLYMGDDFENAFSITYGLDYWADLRNLPPQKAHYQIWNTAATDLSWSKEVRIWLSRHSVIYQLVFHGPLMGLLHGERQIREASELYPGVATSLSIPERNILEAFRPAGLLMRLDQNSEGVLEGMRVTFDLLKRMDDLCKEQGIQFVVVVIPTKESVFAEYFEQNPKLPMGDVANRLIANEQGARSKMFQFLTGEKISFVDTLPALRGAKEHQLYARTAADMHPNGNGYRVIAESVLQALKSENTVH